MFSLTLINILLVVIFYNLSNTSTIKAIKWNGSMANGCYFTGNDLLIVQTIKENCSQQCSQTLSCTHFTWPSNGTCWMKRGLISKQNAIISHQGYHCGLISKEILNVIKTEQN